jgi:hypothetical protein
MHFSTRVRTWRVARLYSELYSEIALSRKPFGIGHTYIYTFCLEWPILWPPRILTFPSGRTDELEGSGRGLIEVPRWTEKNHESLCQDGRCCSQDFNVAPPEYECRLAVPLHRRSQRGAIDPRSSCRHVQTRVRLMKPCGFVSLLQWPWHPPWKHHEKCLRSCWTSLKVSRLFADRGIQMGEILKIDWLVKFLKHKDWGHMECLNNPVSQPKLQIKMKKSLISVVINHPQNILELIRPTRFSAQNVVKILS